MNDSELDRLLKTVKMPVLCEEYWEGFPKHVTTRLRETKLPEAENRKPRRSYQGFGLPRLAWGFGFAAVCLLIGFAVGRWGGGENTAVAPHGVLQNGKLVSEILAMFPNRVRAIVQDERGFRLVLSERDDIPVSDPLYMKICQGERCSSAVTFSGQEVQIAGHIVTVLSDADGGVILVGDRFAWTSEDPGRSPEDLHIQARRLEIAAVK